MFLLLVAASSDVASTARMYIAEERSKAYDLEAVVVVLPRLTSTKETGKASKAKGLMKRQLKLGTASKPVTDGAYITYNGKNAYAPFGAVDIDKDPVNKQPCSPEECKQACTSDPTCDCATYQVKEKKCWKRRECVPAGWTSTFNKGYNVFMKAEAAFQDIQAVAMAAAAATGGTCPDIEDKIDYLGGDLQGHNRKVESMGQCCALCQSVSDCVGVTWRAGEDKTCQLKATIAQGRTPNLLCKSAQVRQSNWKADNLGTCASWCDGGKSPFGDKMPLSIMEWTPHMNKNCYLGHGGEYIPVGPFAGVSLDQCKGHCRAAEGCECFTFGGGACHLRTNCEPSKFASGDNFWSAYTMSQTCPGFTNGNCRCAPLYAGGQCAGCTQCTKARVNVGRVATQMQTTTQGVGDKLRLATGVGVVQCNPDFNGVWKLETSERLNDLAASLGFGGLSKTSENAASSKLHQMILQENGRFSITHLEAGIMSWKKLIHYKFSIGATPTDATYVDGSVVTTKAEWQSVARCILSISQVQKNGAPLPPVSYYMREGKLVAQMDMVQMVYVKLSDSAKVIDKVTEQYQEVRLD